MFLSLSLSFPVLSIYFLDRTQRCAGLFSHPLSRKVLTMKQSKLSPNSSRSVSIANINQLKSQFLTDMELAGLARASRTRYLGKVPAKCILCGSFVGL